MEYWDTDFTVKVELTTSNAAFSDHFATEIGLVTHRINEAITACAEVLNEFADDFEERVIRDSNGNTIGKVTVTRNEPMEANG